MMSKILSDKLLHILFTLTFIITVLVSSCSVFKEVPVETKYNIKDSTIVHMVDSVVYIPKEVIVDVVPEYDTLRLESSKAVAEAYVDTNIHMLRGKIENKEGIEYKYIYKDKIIYRDSVVTKEVPVEVVKEVVKHKHYWYESILWLFTLLSIGYIILKYIKNRYGFFKGG